MENFKTKLEEFAIFCCLAADSISVSCFVYKVVTVKFNSRYKSDKLLLSVNSILLTAENRKYTHNYKSFSYL